MSCKKHTASDNGKGKIKQWFHNVRGQKVMEQGVCTVLKLWRVCECSGFQGLSLVQNEGFVGNFVISCIKVAPSKDHERQPCKGQTAKNQPPCAWAQIVSAVVTFGCIVRFCVIVNHVSI